MSRGISLQVKIHLGALPKSDLSVCLQNEDLCCMEVATEIWGIAHRRAMETGSHLQADPHPLHSLRKSRRGLGSDMVVPVLNPKIWAGFSVISDQTRLGNVVANRSYPLLGYLALAVLPYGHLP